MRFFISYSRTAKQQIQPIIDILRAAEQEVWWDADIPEMADWWATILDEIEVCDVCIFVITEKSVQSPYCLAELRYAIDRNRPVLPMMLDNDTHYLVPPELTQLRAQWLEYDGDAARTLSRIRTACNKIPWERYRDIPASRVVEPNKGSGSLVKEFQQAVNLAENGHFDEAIKRFRNVSSLDFREWGDDCQYWVARLQSYAQISELTEHRATSKRAIAKWNDYLQTFDADFDPFDIGKKLSQLPPSNNETETNVNPTRSDNPLKLYSPFTRNLNEPPKVPIPNKAKPDNTNWDSSIGKYTTTYIFGDDLYDDSFSIDTANNEFLGETGAGISKLIGKSDPKRVAAIEVWVFDKNDIRTVTKILMSEYAFNDFAITTELAPKGEIILIQLGAIIPLETQTLRLTCRVLDLSYGVSSPNPQSYFDRVTLEISAWSK